MTEVGFPFRFDDGGRTAGADAAAHLRELIEQILLTAPGERVMRPDFGAGVGALVFAPAGDALAAALEASVQAALQQTLGARARVLEVTSTAGDGRLEVTVRYAPAGGGPVATVAADLPR